MTQSIKVAKKDFSSFLVKQFCSIEEDFTAFRGNAYVEQGLAYVAHKRIVPVLSDLVDSLFMKEGEHLEDGTHIYKAVNKRQTVVDKRDKEALAVLKAMNHRNLTSEFTGKIVRIDAFYSCGLDKIHPSLRKIVNTADATAINNFTSINPIPVGTKVDGVLVDNNTVLLKFYIQEDPEIHELQYTDDENEINMIFSANHPVNSHMVNLSTNSVVHTCVKVGDKVKHTDNLIIFEENIGNNVGANPLDAFRSIIQDAVVFGNKNRICRSTGVDTSEYYGFRVSSTIYEDLTDDVVYNGVRYHSSKAQIVVEGSRALGIERFVRGNPRLTRRFASNIRSFLTLATASHGIGKPTTVGNPTLPCIVDKVKLCIGDVDNANKFKIVVELTLPTTFIVNDSRANRTATKCMRS